MIVKNTLNNIFNYIYIIFSIFMNSDIDFYVPIIDNYWDIWFALNLALIMVWKNQNLKIRFFCDDKNLFEKMIWNDFLINLKWQISYYNLKNIQNQTPSKNIFTFFDYRLPKDYLQKWEYWKNIIQFWYFLLHKWVKNLHWTTYKIDWNKITHFIPSLLENTWGILINSNLTKENIEQNKSDFINFINKKYSLSIPENITNKKWISVFVYKDTFKEIIETIKKRKNNEVFFIFDWCESIKNEYIAILKLNCYTELWSINSVIINIPFIELIDFNKFLDICNANIVRWENSICTSLSLWKPTLWDIYKESNNAHNDKINDFSNFLLTFNSKLLWYTKVFMEFNNWKKVNSAINFIENYNSYSKYFIELSKNILNNSNLINNLQKYVNWSLK